MRIDKYLCELNKGTRKEVKEYIKKDRSGLTVIS
jgi:16S rRNA U516 pseudouridylate synthase RsuA-like enzyme